MNRPTPAAAPQTPASAQGLRHHYLFSGLSDAQWLRLERHIHRHRLAAGVRLFSQGEAATAFFVVGTGSIKLFRGSPQGLEKIMRLVKAGQSFAESVLFSDPPRYPVHAQAIEESTLIAVDRDIYLAQLRESFDTCRAVMAQMVQRIYAHWDEIEMLSLHGSQARVARYLLGLLAARAEDTGPLRLPTRKVVVAAQLGLAPETLSRALHELIRAKVIVVRGAQIDVLDSAALRRRAQR